MLVYWEAFNLKLRIKNVARVTFLVKFKRKQRRIFEPGTPRMQVSSVTAVLNYLVGGNGSEHM